MANPSEDARYGKRIDLSEKATNSLTLQDLKSKKNDTVELLAEAFNGSKLSKHSIKICTITYVPITNIRIKSIFIFK